MRLRPSLHKALKAKARSVGTSLNSYCISVLEGGGPVAKIDHQVVTSIIQEFNPVGIVLFGSVVRGENTESSDIDLLIVMPDKTSVDRDLYRRWDRVFSENKYSPQFSHPPKLDLAIGSLWLETSLEGEILYDPSGAISALYRAIRSQIAEAVYQRKTVHGHSYWTRKGNDAE